MCVCVRACARVVVAISAVFAHNKPFTFYHILMLCSEIDSEIMKKGRWLRQAVIAVKWGAVGYTFRSSVV